MWQKNPTRLSRFNKSLGCLPVASILYSATQRTQIKIKTKPRSFYFKRFKLPIQWHQNANEEGIPSHRKSIKHNLIHEGKQYPPKLVLSKANIYTFWVMA